MRISGLTWPEDVVEKLREKHDVRHEEAREALASRPHFRRVEKGHRPGKDVYSEVTYYALDKELSQMLSEVAEQRGISAETLLNLWIQEKLWKDASPETA